MPFGLSYSKVGNLNDEAKKHHDDRMKSRVVHNYKESVDPKRQVTKKQKNEIFNDAKTHEQFDPAHIRLDMTGSIVVKDVAYNKNKNEHQRKLALEYEHILPHSEGGRTNERNIGLLNAGINRCKGKNGFKDLPSEKIIDLAKTKCVSPESFITEFSNLGLQHIQTKYDLPFFTKDDGTISIKK